MLGYRLVLRADHGKRVGPPSARCARSFGFLPTPYQVEFPSAPHLLNYVQGIAFMTLSETGFTSNQVCFVQSGPAPRGTCVRAITLSL